MNVKHVVFHYPGPNWQDGVDFREQPDIMEHVAHYAEFLKAGKLSLGGPFTDPDSGGMMIADADVTREELEQFAASDPTVQKGLLKFAVKTWYVAMQKE
ncbi:MAG: YciI family protein [Chloroflexota bacterium]